MDTYTNEQLILCEKADLVKYIEELKEKYKKQRLSRMTWHCLLNYNERVCSALDDWDEPTKDYIDKWVQMFKDEDTIKEHLYKEWSAGWATGLEDADDYK